MGDTSVYRDAAGNYHEAVGVTIIGGSTSALPSGTDRSGTITTANTAQDVAPANPTRVGMTFQNTSDTAMRLTESGADATATTGFVIAPGQAVNVSTNKRISVFCATAGKSFAATES